MARHLDPAVSLERKIGEFASSLPHEERGLFLGILAIAATADDAEVAGFAMEPDRAGIESLIGDRTGSVAVSRKMLRTFSDA